MVCCNQAETIDLPAYQGICLVGPGALICGFSMTRRDGGVTGVGAA